MKRFLILLALSFLLTSCQSVPAEQAFDVGGTPTAPLLEGETALVWEEEETEFGIRLTTKIENPSTGAMLYTYLELPEGEAPYPMVMLLPGGTNSATEKFLDNEHTSNVLLENDIAVAYFDPDGRGKSTGEENSNGSDSQDGLYAITQAIMDTGHVDSEEMGLLSLSYGISLATGMLARYSDTQPYEWYIDWEGPSIFEDISDDRDSSLSLAKITIPYWRIQGAKDHVQATNEHAILAINTATEGLSPWTRINDEDPNQSFTSENPPVYIPKRSQETAINSVFEFFEMY
jgi:hypothetical protein